MSRPYGLELHEKYLYVGEPEGVMRYPYDSQKLTAGRGEQIISLKGFT